MKFYVATSLQNRDFAKCVIKKLVDCGHTLSYDWTIRGDARGISEELLLEVSTNEVEAVTQSELVIILLPGGKGTHTELGLALASRLNKRIIIWSETGVELGIDSSTCAFYHHPAVERLSCGKVALMGFIEGLNV